MFVLVPICTTRWMKGEIIQLDNYGKVFMSKQLARCYPV